MITKQICGFKFHQRTSEDAPVFFVFSASAKEVIKWATINRLKDRQGGTERRLSESRVRAIEKFFREDPINTTPSSIILAFTPGSTTFTPLEQNEAIQKSCDTHGLELGILSFNYDPKLPIVERPAFVVDGQHRLTGMSKFSSEDLPILVLAILNADSTEQAFQFVVVNNKVSRVPTDLLRSLLVDFNKENLEKRLKSARVSLQSQAVMLVATIDEDQDSPFLHMVKWDLRGDKPDLAIKPQAIEASLAYIRHIFPRLDYDEDSLIDFFFALWEGIKREYVNLWNQVENRLFDNAGFRAFTEYVSDQISAISLNDESVDLYDTEFVKNQSQRIASQVPIDFWLANWVGKSLDTSSGRELIKDEIQKIRRNKKDGRNWWEELSLVNF
jgi:DGQHR domain-containing protein